MAKDDDPLLALLTDADAIDRKRIAETLAPYGGIDSKRGTLVPTAAFGGLATRKQILVALLAQKVAVLLDKADDDSLTPEELAAVIGAALGSVRARISDLIGEHRISRVDGRLSVNTATLPQTLAELASTREADSAAAPARTRKRTAGRKRTAKSTSAPAQTESDGDAPAQKTTARKASTKATRKRAPSGGPGPMELLRDLVDAGYFSTPRSLPDVKEHLRHKQGRAYPSTTLSPAFTRLLRDGVLDREKDAEGGNYRYVEKQA